VPIINQALEIMRDKGRFPDENEEGEEEEGHVASNTAVGPIDSGTIVPGSGASDTAIFRGGADGPGEFDSGTMIHHDVGEGGGGAGDGRAQNNRIDDGSHDGNDDTIRG
jgi:hypothetical protein